MALNGDGTLLVVGAPRFTEPDVGIGDSTAFGTASVFQRAPGTNSWEKLVGLSNRAIIPTFEDSICFPAKLPVDSVSVICL